MIHLTQAGAVLEAAALVHGLVFKEMHARLETGLRLCDTGQRILAFYLNEMDVGRVYQATGHPSTVHYAETRLGIEPRRTREFIAVGKKLLTLPAIDAAFCKGEFGWVKVLHLAKVATPEHEAAWLARARTLSCRELALEVRLSKPGSAPRDPGDRKGLPEVRFKLESSLNPITHQKLELAKQKLAAECGRQMNDDEWLNAMADLVLQTDADGSVPGRTRVDSSLYRLVLHPDEESGKLVLETEEGLVPIEGSEAIRCDAEVVQCCGEDGVSCSERRGGPGGHATHDVLDQSDLDQSDLDPKTPAWLRSKVLARDGHRCRNCGSRHDLMAHHMHYRSKGGKTRAKNLVTLCTRCHGLVHANLLVILGDDAMNVRFVDAEGRPISTTGSPVETTAELQMTPPPAPEPPASEPSPATPPVTVLEAIPEAVDGAWWRRHAHLIRLNGKGIEFQEGVPAPEAPEALVPEPVVPEPVAPEPVPFEQAFSSIVGQETLLVGLEIAAKGCQARGRAFPHTLLTGPAGTGKTSIAQALASCFGARMVKASGPFLQDVHQLLRLAANVRRGDVLFLEEVHAIPKDVLEALYEAMAEGRISLDLHSGGRARSIRLDLPAFTLVAATTEEGDLPPPFLSRFGLRESLGWYAKDVLAGLVACRAVAEGFLLDAGASSRVADFARGTPREALRLLDRVLDDAASRGEKEIEDAAVATCFARLGYDALGLDPLEQRYLALLRRSAAPVSVGRLARMLGSNVRTLLREVEPYLFRLGLVDVGPRGRIATRRPRLLGPAGQEAMA